MRLAITLLVLAALGGGGCIAVGEGTGKLVGTLYVRQCNKTSDFGSLAAPGAFNLRPQFFAADPVDDFPVEHPMNRLGIRVQSTGQRVEEADGLVINIASVREIAQSLGTPIVVGPATNLRASLPLNATCPYGEVTPELDSSAAAGGITFTTFGTASAGVPDDFRIQFGDRLTATVSLDVVDRRAITLGGVGAVPTAPALAGHVEGQFDFVVRQGQAAQAYP